MEIPSGIALDRRDMHFISKKFCAMSRTPDSAGACLQLELLLRGWSQASIDVWKM